ncbi:MAG: KamA family radical SAM protein [Candidatus Omnitrophica bacterium]|nr:KamA family radical SAM protein [Candidatus Omnitrophota bacterium]
MEKETLKGESQENDHPPDTDVENNACLSENNVNRDSAVITAGLKSLPRKSIATVEQLSKFINFDDTTRKALNEIVKKYHLLISPYYLSLIKDLNDENDPIRKQCVPAIEELFGNATERIDPLGEKETSVTNILVHRYPDRVLLIATSRCFMYCRHCTRKRLWQNNNVEPSLAEIRSSLDYVRGNESIREIIVSGGDPLTLNQERLDWILEEASSIAHIQAIRIGTRTPVVFPEKITKSLCRILGKYNKLWMNIQFNHPREITPESTGACRMLQKCGIPLSNQTVLLKGINDSPQVMKELCQKLQAIRVRPYYIFQCDEVVGASHFRTSIFKGIEIIEHMRGHTSGMCIPRFVVDGPNGKGKIPLDPQYMLSITPNKVILRNYNNEVFEYYNPQSD